MEHLLYSATSGDSKKILDEIKNTDQDIGYFLHYVIEQTPYYVYVIKSEDSQWSLQIVHNAEAYDGIYSVTDIDNELQPYKINEKVLTHLKSMAILKHENNEQINEKDIEKAVRNTLFDYMIENESDVQVEMNLDDVINNYCLYQLNKLDNAEQSNINENTIASYKQQLKEKLTEMDSEYIYVNIKDVINKLLRMEEQVVVCDIAAAETYNNFDWMENLPLDTLINLMTKKDEWEDESDYIQFNSNRKEHLKEIVDFAKNDIDGKTSGLFRLMAQNGLTLDVLKDEQSLEQLSGTVDSFRKNLKSELENSARYEMSFMAYATKMGYEDILKVNLLNTLANIKDKLDDTLYEYKTENNETKQIQLPFTLTDTLSPELKQMFEHSGIKLENCNGGVLGPDVGVCSSFDLKDYQLEIPYKDVKIDLSDDSRYGYGLNEIAGLSDRCYSNGKVKQQELSPHNIEINQNTYQHFAGTTEQLLKQQELDLDSSYAVSIDSADSSVSSFAVKKRKPK